MIIDPHAHIAPESFIQDVRRKRFGNAVTIEKGDAWELLVVRSTVLGQKRVHKNPLPKSAYDVGLRLKEMEKLPRPIRGSFYEHQSGGLASVSQCPFGWSYPTFGLMGM